MRYRSLDSPAKNLSRSQLLECIAITITRREKLSVVKRMIARAAAYADCPNPVTFGNTLPARRPGERVLFVSTRSFPSLRIRHRVLRRAQRLLRERYD